MTTTTTDRAEDAVKKIVSIALGVSIASLKTTDNLILDLGADSLDILDITMDIEKEFDIEIDDEVAAKFSTVGDLINHVV